jgi:hypothetical protein
MMKIDEIRSTSRQCVHFEDALPVGLDAFEGIVVRCDGTGVTDRRDLLRRVANALRFPDYFGENWDALDECLRDLEWIPGSAYVLVVENAGRLWRESPKLAGALVESWLLASDEWASSNIPFHLIFLWEKCSGSA